MLFSTLTVSAETQYVNVTAYSTAQTKISDYWYDGNQYSYIQPISIKYNDGTTLKYNVVSGTGGINVNNGTYLRGEGYYYNSEGEKIQVDNEYYIGAQGYPAGANHTSVQAQYLGPAEGSKIKIYFSAPYHITSTGTTNSTMIRSANGFYFGSDSTDIQQIYFPACDVLFYYGNVPIGSDGDLSTQFDFELMIDQSTGIISGMGKSDNFWGFLDPIWDYLQQIGDFLAECWNTFKNIIASLFTPSEAMLDKLETIHFPNYFAFVQDNFTAIDDTYDPRNTNYGTFYGADMNIDKLINSDKAIYGNKNVFGGSSDAKPIDFVHRVVEFIYIFFLIILAISLTKKIAAFNTN